MKTSSIHIRDPFVLPQKGIYYLYGTTDKNVWAGKASGFKAYTSADLSKWEGPFDVFTPPDGFWADENFWAPEVHCFGGYYYMFASFKSDARRRGSQILRSKSPLGPFVPLTENPLTPDSWECLDATFFVDGDFKPWIIFSHEWLQIGDGEICALRLSENLTEPEEKPIRLFSASDADWTANVDGRKNCFVTDGPFIYKCRGGQLVMLWSSFSDKGYAIGQAISQKGILGPWTHCPQPLLDRNGGHGMVFRTFEGKLMLTIHMPNETPHEHPVFLEITEENGLLKIK